jgi:integrase
VFEKDVRLADGSVRRVKARAGTRALVLRRMLERERELASTHPSAEELTLDEFLTRWLASKRPVVRGSTYRGYEQDVRLHVRPIAGPKALSRVGPMDVQAVVSAVAATGKLVMADRVRRTLKQALGHAVGMGLLVGNPADRVRPVKRPDPERGVWTEDEGERFLARALERGLDWHALFTLALATGMRKGELLALRWVDVTPDRVHVRRTFSPHTPGGFSSPKTRHGLRSIPITAGTRAVLEKHLIWSPASELVFPRWDGGVLDPRTVSAEFARLCVEARVPRIRFHDLRRTFTTWQFSRGQDPKTVQRMLGHATPALTLSVYADVLDERERSAALEVRGSNAGSNAGERGGTGANVGRARRRAPRRSRA